MKVKLVHPELDAEISVPAGSVPGLTRRGWVRLASVDGLRALASGGAVAAPSPNVILGSAAPAAKPEQIAPAEPGDAPEGIPPTNSQEG